MSGQMFADGYTLQDLISQEGVTLDVENGLLDAEEDFEYSKNVFTSNDDILKYINMGDLDGDDESTAEDKDVVAEQLMLCDVNFSKIRNKMTDILGNGMVMKLVRKEGDGEVVTAGAQISVKYIGQFEYHDEPFDSSYAHGSGPDTYILGQGELLPGLEIGISTMKRNEVSIFLIQPEYAFGKLGCPPRVPPNEEVLFFVNLVDFADIGVIKDFDQMTITEKKAFPICKRRITSVMMAANENFKKEKTRQAIRDYNKAVNILEEAQLANDEEEKDQKELLSRVYVNLAVCYNKENKPRNACVVCEKVPNPSAKSYFHFGRALIKLGEYEKAKEQLWKSMELEPQNNQTKREIKLADTLQKKYTNSEKRLWENCLKISKEETARTEFEKAAHEICENFKNDEDLVRHPLPDGLTPAEDKIMRSIAFSHGLSVANLRRYGKEIVYLTKSNN